MSEDEVVYSHKKEKTHNVGQILRTLMQEKQIDDGALAKAINMPLSSLSRIKNDPLTNPTLASLQPIARYFNITVSQLIGETALNKIRIKEPLTQNTFDIKQVPLIDWGQINDFINNKLTDITQWLPSCMPLSEKAFALCVETDNWGEPLNKNALLIIDFQKKYNDGDYTLVKYKQGQQYFIKRILHEGADVYLQSLNPDIKLTERLKPEEQLFAVVMEIRYRLRK